MAQRFPRRKSRPGYVWGIEPAEAERWAGRYRANPRPAITRRAGVVPPGWLTRDAVARLLGTSAAVTGDLITAGQIRGEVAVINGVYQRIIPVTEVERLRLTTPSLLAAAVARQFDCTYARVVEMEQLGWLERLPSPWPARRRYSRASVVALLSRYRAIGIPMPADYVTIGEAADMLNLTTGMVIRGHDRGLAPVCRFGRYTLYRCADVEHFRDHYPRRGITAAIARGIARRGLAGEDLAAIAADYRITRARVVDIVNGRTWAWFTRDLRPAKQRRPAA